MNNPGQATGQRVNYGNLIRPQQLAKVPGLDNEQRIKLYSAIQQAWSVLESQPAESGQHKSAYSQLFNITRSMTMRVQQHRAQQGQAQGQTQGQQINPNAGQAPNQAMRLMQQGDQKPQIKAEADRKLWLCVPSRFSCGKRSWR
jgi:hypothetical protein